MDQSIRTALMGALSSEHRMATIANNLANVNTTGFKRTRLGFRDVFYRYAHDWAADPRLDLRQKKLLPDSLIMSVPRLTSRTEDFSQGSFQATGNTFDLAIGGKGFFRVQTPDGEYLTRNGEFILTSEGQLVDKNGNALLGDGGPIEVPLNQQPIRITTDGRVIVGSEQTQLAGTISIVTVEDESVLEKYGKHFFRAKPGQAIAMGAPEPNDGLVYQGFLEKPNVEVVEEMVNMIETQRAFECYQKVMTTVQDIDQRSIQKVGEVKM